MSWLFSHVFPAEVILAVTSFSFYCFSIAECLLSFNCSLSSELCFKKVHQTPPKEERSRGFNSKWALNRLVSQSHTHLWSHSRSWRREEERKKSRGQESKWGESESESGGRLICQRWKLETGWRTCLSVCRCLRREDYRKLHRKLVSYQILNTVAHSNQTFLVLYHFGTCPAVADAIYSLSSLFLCSSFLSGLSHLKVIQ